MSQWWVRYEEELGYNQRWFGPYKDLDRAQSEARRRSVSYDAADRFAEVIQGPAGGRGKRFLEYFRGEEFPPGESTWYGFIPAEEIDIPEQSPE